MLLRRPSLRLRLRLFSAGRCLSRSLLTGMEGSVAGKELEKAGTNRVNELGSWMLVKQMLPSFRPQKGSTSPSSSSSIPAGTSMVRFPSLRSTNQPVFLPGESAHPTPSKWGHCKMAGPTTRNQRSCNGSFEPPYRPIVDDPLSRNIRISSS